MDQLFGAQLKQIRESKGISLETIAHKTHISLAYLQALERDDVESLPSKVQLRGFLRLYANELGVKLDDLTVKDDHFLKKKPPSIATEQAKVDEESQPSSDEEPKAIRDQQEPDEKAPDPEQNSKTEQLVQQSFEPEQIDSSEHKESAIIFKSIGDTIKKRRILLSLSIEDIHNNLHIPTQHLESIEKGRFDQLPSPVQARGLLVNYADFLNLDTDSLLMSYSDALQLQRIEKQDTGQKRERRSARELSPGALRLKNFFTLDLLVITALFIAFAGFVIWGVNRILATDPPAISENDIPGVSDVLLATDTPTPMEMPETDVTIMPEDQEEEAEIIEQEEPLFTPVASTDPINVLLVPRQRLWVQVTVDDEMVFQGRLIPGNAYDFSGQEQIDILTGNVGGMQILFNNQDIGSPGLLGQVANLSFTADGLILPSPTSTPTITETPQATPMENND